MGTQGILATMVRLFRFPASGMLEWKSGFVGTMAVLVLGVIGSASAAWAQKPDVFYWHQGAMPPGAIGSRQLQRGGPLAGFHQPVEIKAPPGALISLAAEGGFGEPRRPPVRLGMLIGRVYRVKVTNIPLQPGLEVFPTIELIDRLYTPSDQILRFPIPIEITEEELRLAISGQFVTRVIYVEEPWRALPVQLGGKSQSWFEVGPGEDPLATADAMGRPVAILRLGGRLPQPDELLDARFFFGFPPYVELPGEVKVLAPPPERPVQLMK